MRIVRRDLVPHGPGRVKMVPVDADDLWFVYNLISPGDSVMAVTVRKVLRQAATAGRDAERMKLMFEIKVEEVADYDSVGSVLRIHGKNVLENEHVKIGAFHTLELELHRPFVLQKVLVQTRGTSPQLHARIGGRAKRRQPNLWPYGWSILVIGLEIKQA